MSSDVGTSFTEIYGGPEWLCPECEKALLKIVDGSLFVFESVESEILHGHPDWTPDWVEKRFTCMFRCTNARCEEPVAVAGVTVSRSYIDRHKGEVHYDQYLPKFVHPSPNFVPLPPELPQEISTELRASFTLFWFDPSSAANKVRSAVELLMNDFKIPRLMRAAGRTERLSLNRRIQLFQKKEPAHGESLLAVKWIGNAGSHYSGITQADMLDVYEILGHVFDELYSHRSKRVRKLALAINKSSGPITNKARRRLKRI